MSSALLWQGPLTALEGGVFRSGCLSIERWDRDKRRPLTS